MQKAPSSDWDEERLLAVPPNLRRVRHGRPPTWFRGNGRARFT